MSLPYGPTWDGFVVGSDEAGYGAWAGPLYVAAVVVPTRWIPRVKIGDSKTMSPMAREKAFDVLTVDPDIHFFKVRSASPEEIDQQGVYKVLLQLHTECIQAGLQSVEALPRIAIVDGTLKIPNAISIPKADVTVPAVSAASIFAKVLRDRAMTTMATTFPEYGFAKHKGYGVPAHQRALERFGPCSLHRKSYEPIIKILRERATEEPPTSWEIPGEEDT